MAGEGRTAADPPSVGVAALERVLSGVNILRGVELDTRAVLLRQLQAVAVALLWLLACAAHSLLALLPSLAPVPVLASTLKRLSSLAQDYDPIHSVAIPDLPDQRRRQADFSTSPGARALTQVLALVNEVSASSNKYEFLRGLADRVIEENEAEGVKFNAVNQAALRRGFSRTINLLGQSLESRPQRGSFLGRVVSHFSSTGLLPSVALPVPLVKIRSLIGNMLYPLSVFIPQPDVNEVAHLANHADSDIAEKLAKELLWIAGKMKSCGAVDDAVKTWSSVPSLAELSLCASPKVQKSLVRLSALLLAENANIPHEVCLQLVLSWLPLLCNATHGGDSPIFSTEQKRALEKQLEQLVAGLPDSDQEQVLSAWLHEYALSQSDFPNLQKCYSTWYSSMRKLEVGMPKIRSE